MAVRCKKQFEYEECDEDGSSTGKYGCIDGGEEFDDYEVCNAWGIVRLSNEKRWLEISKKMFDEYFEEVTECTK